ncbi:hypothetical protein [Curtobacterium flaccumfaciens]|uniref:hypothetical protein n=1 Tax=Curtobacterium flaccumfaciens TaxID=2035 RepID=UPI001366A835|nr:hypothetical protein [Curtobacterium flaccumfaciens]MBT1664369.1 hypothetical protein [Curtobacterium flaccumfaciens pv. flaccumfaciens]QFS79190.2 hypothetical protein GBG65_05995 [Curtobacterium flaccumfaciens pv. flaccumfaciens]
MQWLVEHDTEQKQLTEVVTLLVDAASKLLDGLDNSTKAARRERILDHLWCDLVASVVRAIEALKTLEGSTKDAVAEAIAVSATDLLKATRAPGAAADEAAGLSLESAAIQGCIRGVVKVALDGATAGLDAYLGTMLTKLRVAGVMLCPDIGMHNLVWEHCWLPLWNDAIGDALLEELARYVPGLKPASPAPSPVG